MKARKLVGEFVDLEDLMICMTDVSIRMSINLQKGDIITIGGKGWKCVSMSDHELKIKSTMFYMDFNNKCTCKMKLKY